MLMDASELMMADRETRVPFLMGIILVIIATNTASKEIRTISMDLGVSTKRLDVDSFKKVSCAAECMDKGNRCSGISINTDQMEKEFCKLNTCDRNVSLIVFWKSMAKIPFVRRQDGSVNFVRDWSDYKSGFGDAKGEFWLGLEKLHQVTSSGNYGLFVELLDGNICRFAVYDSITVGNEGDYYRLAVTGYQNYSTAGDSIIANHGYGPISGKPFSTYDFGPDKIRCAAGHSGWWMGNCYDACATGLYNPPDPYVDGGVQWFSAFNDWRSFTYTEWSLIPK